MSEKKRVWVSPDGEKGWNVKTEGKSKAAANFEDKSDAIAKAKEIAQNATKGQVIIRNASVNGGICCHPEAKPKDL